MFAACSLQFVVCSLQFDFAFCILLFSWHGSAIPTPGGWVSWLTARFWKAVIAAQGCNPGGLSTVYRYLRHGFPRHTGHTCNGPSRVSTCGGGKSLPGGSSDPLCSLQFAVWSLEFPVCCLQSVGLARATASGRTRSLPGGSSLPICSLQFGVWSLQFAV